jgi:hypothetical protein
MGSRLARFYGIEWHLSMNFLVIIVKTVTAKVVLTENSCLDDKKGGFTTSSHPCCDSNARDMIYI